MLFLRFMRHTVFKMQLGPKKQPLVIKTELNRQIAVFLKLMGNIFTWVENRVFQNILVWTLVLMVASITVVGEWYDVLFIVGYVSIPVYINNLVVQRHLYNKNKTRWALLFTANILVFSIIGTLVLASLADGFEFKILYSVIGFLVLMISFGGAVKMAKDSFVRRQQMKEAELKLLKAQMNPHFLFNTLNNLYGLSVSKSDKLPDLMLKLSDLMRYNLYETHDTTVVLDKEVVYLRNYIALEQIRLENDVEIVLDVEDYPLDFKIAPMILIVFVENAFKYIATNSAGEKYVRISITVKNDQLDFVCENSFMPSLEKRTNTEGGLGLANTSKRLQFMYPGTHDLNVDVNENRYKVNLKLNRL